MNFDKEVLLEAELIEQAFTKTLCCPPGSPFSQDGRAYCYELANDCLLVASAADVLYVNRVLGAGLHKPVSERLLQDIHACYEQYGSKRYFIQVAPEYLEESRDVLLKQGGIYSGNWVKLLKKPQRRPIPDAATTVRHAQEEDYDAMATLLIKGFNWPDSLLTFCRDGLGKPGWTHYVAVIDGRIVGTGSLFRHGKYAALGVAATDAAYRNHGVQTALINAREQQAFDEGCPFLFVETIEPTGQNVAPSFRNMQHAGFTELYRRPNYLFG